jgi:hypothetical protein
MADREALQKEFDDLAEKLKIDVDPAATGVKKSLVNLLSKQKTPKSTVSSKLKDAERKKMMKRYEKLGQMLADMPDKETQEP